MSKNKPIHIHTPKVCSIPIFVRKKDPAFLVNGPHFPQILPPPQHSKGPRCHEGDPGDTDLEKMGWIPCHLGRHKLAFGRSKVKSSRNWSPHLDLKHGSLVMSPCFTSPNHDRYFWSTRWLLFQVMSNIPKSWDSYQPL